jgi:hypothetical protein
MKRYLWIGGLVLSLNAYAANNPFDIAKNMQKIEAEDSLLLDTLEEESGHKNNLKSDDFTVHNQEVEEVKAEEKKVDNPMPKDVEEKRANTEVTKAVETPKVVNTQENKTQTPVQEPKTTASTPKAEDIIVDIDAPIKQDVQKPKVVETPKEKEDIQTEDESTTPKPSPVEENMDDDKQKDDTLAPSVADINVTKEKIEAEKRAKQALQEAIQEVDRED